MEIANTIQGHFATVECAKFMSLENLAQQHNDRPAIGTVLGILVMVQRQISQSQSVQNPFVHYSDSVVDVPVIVHRGVPQNSDRVVDVPAVLQRQVPIFQSGQNNVEVLHERYIDKLVDVPVLLLRQVPVFPVLLPQMQCSEKIVKVPDGMQRLVPNFQNEAAQVLSCENVISLHQLARQIAGAQCFLSPALDGFTNDMPKRSPQQVARHLHPLLCKMSLGCKEPLMLKGSLATDLYKGRGCKLDMTS